MSPRHFSKLNKEQQAVFDHDIKMMTGMLYSIAKWPLKPFTPAFYRTPFIPALYKKTEAEVKKDYEPIYNPPTE